MKLVLIRTNGYDALIAVEEKEKKVSIFYENSLSELVKWTENGKEYKPLKEITENFDESRGYPIDWVGWEEIKELIYDERVRDFEVIEEINLQ